MRRLLDLALIPGLTDASWPAQSAALWICSNLVIDRPTSDFSLQYHCKGKQAGHVNESQDHFGYISMIDP